MARLSVVARSHSIAVLLTLAVTATAAGQVPLVDAAADRDYETVRVLVRQKVNVNAARPDGATALHWVAYADDVKTADLLIRAGARVNTPNDYGVTPLLLAAENGSAAMGELLLAAGANPNTALPTGETVLMAASRTGNLTFVRALIARGADVRAKEAQQGQTALMWAAAAGHADVARALIEAGADVNGRTTGGEFAPLHFAARVGAVDVARVLVRSGADVNAAAKGAPWCPRCGAGGEPLLVAVMRGHTKLAEFLLEQGANPNGQSAGYTALHWASGSWETTLRFPDRTSSGEWNALTGLKGLEKAAFVKTLLAHGANPNARTTKNPSRVGGGSQVDAPVLFQNLIEATPFLLAAQAGDAATMRLLVEAGHPLAMTIGRFTPLMQAAGIGRVNGEHLVSPAQALEAVKLALELGGDVNAVADTGDTALHAAAVEGTNDIVKLLVEHGARVDIKNKDGDTPWLIAAGHGIRRGGINPYQPATAALLLQHGAKEEEKVWTARNSDLERSDAEQLKSGLSSAGAQLKAIEEERKRREAEQSEPRK